MLEGVWMEKKYKEEVEVSIVGSVFTLFMVAITSSLNEPLCWPLISSFVQKCAKILTLLTVLGTEHCIHLDQKLIILT